MPSTKVLRSDVFHALATLNPRKTYGPDGVPPFVLKNCASAFHGNLWAKGDTFWGTSYLKVHPLGNLAPSEEAQPTLGPWTRFELVRLDTP
ncbi:hypothetical protein E2C01_025220 [Portunus trituberculatus]|uniref:Uncharacterized protein n=1 Tax=Portunus trituberculatus TaxID=210409 RepID=A0A5B7ECE5_PORTR|nr:hypothetical protein [Portunus trituberculatus]